MASSPNTSRHIDEGKVETVVDFILLGSKITMDLDCNHKIKTHLLLVSFFSYKLFDHLCLYISMHKNYVYLKYFHVTSSCFSERADEFFRESRLKIEKRGLIINTVLKTKCFYFRSPNWRNHLLNKDSMIFFNRLFYRVVIGSQQNWEEV